jgi:pantoate--beta-alanine ligase
MGSLHEGHLTLVRLARGEAQRVVLTIFVNPTQFGPGEDFSSYPRALEEDRRKLAGAAPVDLLFAPPEEEIYPFGHEAAVRVVVPKLGDDLCGASRPGHFEGVTSVVCRLLNIVSPDVLVLGEKDYQQLVLLTRMIEDLRLPVRVVSGPIRREADGLAMSSRNAYLTEAERKSAPALHAELQRLRRAVRDGSRDYAALQERAMRSLEAAGFRPEYVEVRRAADLTKPPAAGGEQGELRALGAAWLGRTRLIDNVSV